MSKARDCLGGRKPSSEGHRRCRGTLVLPRRRFVRLDVNEVSDAGPRWALDVWACDAPFPGYKFKATALRRVDTLAKLWPAALPLPGVRRNDGGSERGLPLDWASEYPAAAGSVAIGLVRSTITVAECVTEVDPASPALHVKPGA